MKKVNMAKPEIVDVGMFLEDEVYGRLMSGRITLGNVSTFDLPGGWSDQCKQAHLCLKTAEEQLKRIIKALRDEAE